MVKRATSSWLRIAGIVAILAMLAMIGMFLLRGFGDAVSSNEALGASGASHSLSESGEYLEFGDIESLADHLGEEGEVDIVREGIGVPERRLPGLGRLAGDDRAMARSGLEKVVASRRAEVDVAMRRPDDAWESVEKRNLEHLQLLLREHRAQCFLDAFDKGSYYLVRGSEDKLPNPEGVMAMNLGVMHGGSVVLLVVLARRDDSGLVGMEAAVRDARNSWLSRVAYQFNSKSDEERASIVRRWILNRSEDREWRERVIPKGLRVDDRAMIVYLP